MTQNSKFNSLSKTQQSEVLLKYKTTEPYLSDKKPLSKLHKNDLAIVLGAGPIGLWSVIKILENNYCSRVIIAEKRFSRIDAKNSWNERDMVVQFHGSLLNAPTIKQQHKCPHGISKEKNEEHRSKYSDLDHMSIRNIQTSLLKHLNENYSDKFELVQMIEMGKTDKPHINIDIKKERFNNLFKNSYIHSIIDATGYHSHFMNGVLEIQFDGNTEYGCALKITWPEHEVITTDKRETEFHDCHENSDFLAKGYSSVAEFSYPISKMKSFLQDCGYKIENAKSNVDFLKEDVTDFSIKLYPFINRILATENSDKYDIAKDLFSTIRKGKLKGINGFDFINKLKQFRWKEADLLSLVIRNTINKSITKNNIYQNIDADQDSLQKVCIVFVPSRIERWLKTNNVITNIRVNVTDNNKQIDIINQENVKAFAIGDSLASTDFRHGLGINRGIHTAVQIFEHQIEPEEARKNLILNSYQKLNNNSDQDIFDRAVACRDWLLKTNKR